MSPRKKEDFEKMQELSREKILKAALALFAQKGYSSTSVESIALKAKISKGLIYHYFKSKEEILKGIFSILMENLNRFMADNHELAPKKYIQKLLEYSFQFIIYQSKINRFLIALSIQPKVVAGLKEDMDNAKQFWMEQLTQMFRKLNYEQPEAEAYLLGAIFDGVGIGYQALGKDYPINEIQALLIKKYKL